MLRTWHFCILGAMAFGRQGVPDAVFEKVPFDEWLKGGGEARIRWSLRIVPAHLTVYQRLATVVSVEVEGAEFVMRNKPGQVVIFLEIRDRDNRVYRTHRGLAFEELKKPGDLAVVSFDQHAFVTPGNYEVAAAVYDAESKEHSLKRTKLRVPKLAHDPLPGAWQDLPDVEFPSLPDPPDRWYLPDVTSRLHLPVQTERQVRVEVVVNESPTEMAMRHGRVSRRNMGNLIPALKVISQMEISNGSMNVTLLDLERRKVSFAQEAIGNLDWTRLRAALIENDPDRIDVHALENHEQNAQFFVTEIRKRLERTESGKPARVLIVLSAPMAFPKGQDLRPIEAAPEPGSRTYYIRSQAEFSMQGFQGRRRGIPPGARGPARGPAVEDSLERTLKPLAPRLFDVTTPEQFRQALGAIMKDISQLK